MIATAVSSEGVRSSERSRDIVEWLTPVRIAKARWLIPRSRIAVRSHPPKSPCNTRLGRGRSSTGRRSPPFSPGPAHVQTELG
jgi:hypothetical protein